MNKEIWRRKCRVWGQNWRTNTCTEQHFNAGLIRYACPRGTVRSVGTLVSIKCLVWGNDHLLILQSHQVTLVVSIVCPYVACLLQMRDEPLLQVLRRRAIQEQCLSASHTQSNDPLISPVLAVSRHHQRRVEFLFYLPDIYEWARPLSKGSRSSRVLAWTQDLLLR